MGETLADFFLERGALDGDPTAAIAGAYDVPPEAVYYHPIAAIPYPVTSTRLIVGWYMHQGPYPWRLSITPIHGATLRLSPVAALRQLCSDLGVSCIGDIGEDVVPEWVRVSPDGRVEPVAVDEDDLENGSIIVYELDAPVTAN